jgi:hypothetical protein
MRRLQRLQGRQPPELLLPVRRAVHERDAPKSDTGAPARGLRRGRDPGRERQSTDGAARRGLRLPRGVRLSSARSARPSRRASPTRPSTTGREYGIDYRAPHEPIDVGRPRGLALTWA